MRCSRCGHENNDDQNFCGNCGFDLRQARQNPSPASYTPHHLAERILATRHLMTGERKRVTVMFADMVGSTTAIQGADPEDAASFLNVALGAMMDAIHRFEGTVNELRGDGIMALFGAPIAHEDHAERACRAALAIPGAVRRATDGEVSTRVGLHTGEVLVREIGNDLSVEYQALGPTVHLAARMEQMARPGSTLITANVERLVRGAITTEAVGPLDVKGFDEPVVAYRLTGSSEMSPWRVRAARGVSGFVGRADEVGRLVRMAAEVDDGGGRAVFVSGDAGVGKSRLVHELLESDAVAGFSVIAAESTPFDTNTAYAPVRTAISRWLGTERTDWTADTLRSAVESIDPSLPDAVPALGALLLPTAAAIGHEVPALEGDQRRRLVRDAIRRLITAAAAHRPIAFVFEDLHWIDGESSAVMADLIDAAADSPLLVVATHRPDAVVDRPAGDHVRHLEMGQLDRLASTRLVDQMLGDDASLDLLKSRILERAGGTPLIIEESVRAIIDAGVVVGEAGDYATVSDDATLEIPDGVHALIAARIDRLEPLDKHVLQVASVVGAVVDLDVLTVVSALSDEEIDDALGRLQQRAFLYVARTLPTPRFQFGHALMRDVAYESLPLQDRRHLHGLIVRALETDHRTTSAERLAFHAARGELDHETVAYATAAADAAIGASAYREAAAFLRDTIDALSRLPQDRDIVERAIDARMQLRVAETGAAGGLRRIQADLAEAQRLAESIGDDDRRAHLAIHQGYTLNMLGDPEAAERHADRARKLAAGMTDPYLRVESHILRAQIFDYAGYPTRVPDELQDHVEYLTGVLRYETRGQTMIRSVVALTHLSMSLAAMGEFEESTRHETEATAIADEAGRPFDLMYARWARGIRLSFEGDAEASVESHRRSIETAEANDIVFMTTFAQPWLGHALTLAGRPRDATSLLDRVRTTAARIDLPYVEALADAFGAEAAAAAGDDETSHTMATSAFAFHERFPTPLIALITHMALARTSAPERVTHLDLARTLADRQGFRVWSERLTER